MAFCALTRSGGFEDHRRTSQDASARPITFSKESICSDGLSRANLNSEGFQVSSSNVSKREVPPNAPRSIHSYFRTDYSRSASDGPIQANPNSEVLATIVERLRERMPPSRASSGSWKENFTP